MNQPTLNSFQRNFPGLPSVPGPALWSSARVMSPSDAGLISRMSQSLWEGCTTLSTSYRRRLWERKLSSTSLTCSLKTLEAISVPTEQRSHTGGQDRVGTYSWRSQVSRAASDLFLVRCKIPVIDSPCVCARVHMCAPSMCEGVRGKFTVWVWGSNSGLHT